MALLNRTGLQLVAGAGVIFLVGCSGSGGGGGSSASQTPASPTFSLQPADQTQPAGGGATFTVAALGNGTLSYQWTKDGAALPGATAATFTRAGLTAADAGVYLCKVTNTSGGTSASAQSSPALLVVNVPPAIAAQPDPAPTLIQGGTVTLTVAATGNGALSYQWQKDGKAIQGATKATLVLANVASTDAGTYTCVVTATLNGTHTATTSAPSVLGVGQLPTLASQPLALQTVVLGAPAAFSVTASGNGSLSYQWLKDGLALDATANPSAATASLALAAAQAADAGAYTCAVTNTVNGIPGTLATGQAVLAVNVPPQVGALSAQTQGQGGNVTFTVAATGNGTLSYQWSKGGVAIPGATAPALTLTGVQPADAADYACVVTNTLNGTTTTTSTDATLAVNPGPSVAPLADQTQIQGGAASFTAVATHLGTLSYQWQKNGAPIDPVANPSAATATLTLSSLAVADGGAYRCVVTDTVNGVSAPTTSNAANLTINQQPVFGGPVANQGFTLAGGTAVFTAAATSNGTLSYQWYQGAAPNGTAVGASNATGLLNLTGLLAAANGSTYYCVATSTLNGTTITATSSPATLVLDGAPTFTTQLPATVTAGVGGPATLTVAASASGTLGYQWYKGALGAGTAIAGATSASLTLPSVAKTDAGSTYYCVVTSVFGSASVSATSSLAALAVNWAPTWDTIDYGSASFSVSNPALVKQGATADMTGQGVPAIVDQTANPAGTIAYTYQWYKNGAPISAGGTLAIKLNSYSTADSGVKITGAQVSDIGSYTCVATRTLNGGAAMSSVPSAAANLYVLATPVITTQPASATVNQGTPGTFTVALAQPANGTLYYQWYKGAAGSGAPIQGGTAATLTLASPKATDSGTTYYCTITNKDIVNAPSLTNAVTTTVATLTVNPVLTTAPVTMDPTVAAGKTDLVASTPDQGPQVTYAWTVVDANANNLVTGASNLRTVSYAAPAAVASGPVTATVTVTSKVDATFVTGTAKALVKSVAFVTPDIIAPPVIHPGDTWPKAFTTANTGETYAWTYVQGTAAKGGTFTSGSNTTATLGFYSTTSTNPMNDTFTLSLNGQLNGDNATTTFPVNVRTGAWVTKDGSNPTFFGSYPTATTLANGRVLLTGGQLFSASSAYLTSSSAFIYDPGTGRMIPTGSMNVARTQHTATLLDNGMVLVVGGLSTVTNGLSSSGSVTTYLNSAEVWDPATGLWTAVPATMANARALHAAYKYTDGTSRVAIIGGTSNGSSAVGPIEIFDPSVETWSVGPTLKIPRYNHTVTVLANDTVNNRTFVDAGKILILGGTGGTASNNQSTLDAKWQPEIWDGTTVNAPAKTSAMTAYPRNQHTAVRLKDSNVFIAGSSATTVPTLPATSTSIPALTGELFSPSTTTSLAGTFTATGTMLGGPLGATPGGRAQATANLLPDGTVLLAGGVATGGAADKSTSFSMELFTPSGAPSSGGTFSYTNAAPAVAGVTSSTHEAHIAHASAQLPSGQVVLVGGKTPAATLNVSNLAEIYTPVSGATPASITVPSGTDSGRLLHQTVQLANNNILVIGGVGTLAGTMNGSNYSFAYLDTCRIYNPTTQTWTATGSLNIPRKDFAVALLANGNVLVTGGKTNLNGSGDASAELWNPAANDGAGAWTLLPSYLNSARCLHSMVALQDGRVLVMGGANAAGGLATCEIYANGAFTLLPASGNMSEPKGYLTPILIPSGVNAGKVVLLGGAAGAANTSGATASAQVEVFDPTTNTWNKNMTPLQTARALHNTILLPSGKIVVLGGMTTLSSGSGVFAGIDPASFQGVAGTATETYDLTLNGGLGGSVQWSPGVYSKAVWTADGHRGAGAVLISNSGPNSGKVLVVGGPGATASGTPPAFNPNSGAVVEVYDPATDTFSATGLDPLPVPRRYNFFGGGDTFEFTVNVMGGTSSTTKSDVIVIGGAFAGGAANIFRP